MNVHVVALIATHDRDANARYAPQYMEIFDRYDSRLLAIDEAPRVLEGNWP